MAVTRRKREGRPRVAPERRMVVLSTTITPQMKKWINQRADHLTAKHGEEVTVSAVTRAMIRFARAELEAGRFPDNDWDVT